MKKIFSKEMIIGLCVLVALVVLFVGIDFLKGINVFKAANYYYATYTNVEGLAISSPVNINGYKVGLVRDIRYEYDNPGHVLVEMSLNRELKVPKGSKAVLATDILGTAVINLELAPNSDFHAVGDKLIGENKRGMMEAVGQDLMPAAAAILPKVDSLLTSLNTLASDPALVASVRRLDAITASLQSTTASLAKATASLQPVMNDVKTITSNAGEITSDVAVLSSQLRELPVDSLMTDIQATVASLRTISQELSNPNSSIGKLMNDPELYNNINSTVQSLDSLFIDIKKNPKRYISIKLL